MAKKTIDNNTPIPYPVHMSHDDIKSYLLYKLRRLKLDARSEVSTKGYGRLDIVVFDEYKAPRVIIEVKPGYPTKRFWERLPTTKRFIKYKSLGLPLFCCKGYKMIDQAVQFTLQCLSVQTCQNDENDGGL